MIPQEKDSNFKTLSKDIMSGPPFQLHILMSQTM